MAPNLNWCFPPYKQSKKTPFVRAFVCFAREYACKPSSVLALGRAAIIYLGRRLLMRLKRPYPGAERAVPSLLYSVLLRTGFTGPASRLAAGELLPRLSTLACAVWRPSAVSFCGTFLGVASTGRYPAPCPAELGLSSGTAFRHSYPRSPGILARQYLLYLILPRN